MALSVVFVVVPFITNHYTLVPVLSSYISFSTTMLFDKGSTSTVIACCRFREQNDTFKCLSTSLQVQHMRHTERKAI